LSSRYSFVVRVLNSGPNWRVFVYFRTFILIFLSFMISEYNVTLVYKSLFSFQ